jgi:hypothetical protein
MIFGESIHARRERIQLESSHWQRYFAWTPTYLEDDRWAWLCFIEKKRKCHPLYTYKTSWKYRAIPAEEQDSK